MTPDDRVRLKLEPGFPSQGAMKLRVSPNEADALVASIEAEGLRCGPVLEHSFDPTSTAAYLVYGITTGGAAMAGTLDRLAKAISAWSHRHDGKTIELYENGTIKSVKGYSVEQARALVDGVVERQRQIDSDWEQATGRGSSIDDGRNADSDEER